MKKPMKQYEVWGTVGQDGNVAEMDKEGRAISDDRGMEEMGEEREKGQCLEDSISAGEEDPQYVIAPFIPTELEHQDFYISGELMDVMKEGTGVYSPNQGGSSSFSLVNVEGEQFAKVPLEVEPLEAYPDFPEGKVCEWVMERVKGMCHVWGTMRVNWRSCSVRLRVWTIRVHIRTSYF